MIYIIVTILIAIIVIVLLHKIASKNGFNEHMKHIPNNEMSIVAALFMTVMLFLVFWIFGENDFFSDTGVKILGCLLLFNFIISFTVSKFILGLIYKLDHYSLDQLKKKEKEEEIKERNKMSIWKKLAIFGAIVGGFDSNSKDKVNEKLEKEMDYNYLDEHEKELVRKGDYDPTNFEYPENEEELGEDDYYSDDDSWK